MRKIACLFPGQGAQYVGMGKEFCDTYPIAQRTFAEANEVLGYNLQKICFHGDLEELTRTENTQPAILTHSVAAFRVLEEEMGFKPDFMAGHSLGEYSALVCSGALNFKEAVELVHLRGKFMQMAVPEGVGGMMAVMKLTPAEVDRVCSIVSTNDQLVVAANYNSPKQIVISGHHSALQLAAQKLQEMGGLVRQLKVSAPFHSPLMESAAYHLEEKLRESTSDEMRCAVISNVTALPYQGSRDLVDLLTQQMTAPVRWQESMEYLVEQGVETVLEIGPGKVLKNLLKRSLPSVKVLNLDTGSELALIQEELTPKANLVEVISRSLAMAVTTRNRNTNKEEYQTGVIEPYHQLQQLRQQVIQEERDATLKEAQTALELLTVIMKTKKVSLTEQRGRFNEIFEKTDTWKLFSEGELR